MDFTESERWWKRAKAVIPAGTQTMSKSPDRFVEGITPKFIFRGKGAHVFDVDDNEFIDYPMGLGAITLGYGIQSVTQAVMAAYDLGNLFSLMSYQEVLLAEKLKEIIPCCEKVRFAKNGADATMGAVRIARAVTGREHIIYITPGYHGCQDWTAITGGWTRGIPEFNKTIIHGYPYNEAKLLEVALKTKNYAAVIMEQGLEEPAHFDPSLHRISSVNKAGLNFLELIRELTWETDTLFIMDEIVTGFRYSLGGAQQKYNVKPDLACFGKGMANGLPISALCGKAEYMKTLEDGVFYSFTFGGDTVAIAAALEVIKIFEERDVIEHMYKLGEELREGIRDAAEEFGIRVEILGNEVRTVLRFLDITGRESYFMKSLFLQETIKRNILFGVPIFICWSHTHRDIEQTVDAVRAAFRVMKEQEDNPSNILEGPEVKPPFVRNS